MNKQQRNAAVQRVARANKRYMDSIIAGRRRDAAKQVIMDKAAYMGFNYMNPGTKVIVEVKNIVTKRKPQEVIFIGRKECRV